jgi:hypothetical protein
VNKPLLSEITVFITTRYQPSRFDRSELTREVAIRILHILPALYVAWYKSREPSDEDRQKAEAEKKAKKDADADDKDRGEPAPAQ